MVVIARLWINIDWKWSDFFEFFYLSFLLCWLSGNVAMCNAEPSGIGLQVALAIRRLSPPPPTSGFAARLFHQAAAAGVGASVRDPLSRAFWRATTAALPLLLPAGSWLDDRRPRTPRSRSSL